MKSIWSSLMGIGLILMLATHMQPALCTSVEGSRQTRTASPPMGHLLRFARQWRQRHLRSRDADNAEHLMRFSRADTDHLLRFARADTDEHLLRFARDAGLEHFLRNARNDEHLLRFARRLNAMDDADDVDEKREDDGHLLRFA